MQSEIFSLFTYLSHSHDLFLFASLSLPTPINTSVSLTLQLSTNRTENTPLGIHAGRRRGSLAAIQFILGLQEVDTVFVVKDWYSSRETSLVSLTLEWTPPIHFSPLLVYFCFHISTQLDPLLLMYMIRQPEYCRHSCGCQSFYSCQSLRSESSPYLYFGTGGTGREANTGEDFTVVCPEPDNQKPNVAIGCNVKATEWNTAIFFAS